MDSKKKKNKKAKSKQAELLNKTLWVYKTTQKTFTSETLFLLAYGTEVMILVKIECPNYRVVQYTS